MSKQILIVLGILLVFGCADVSKENQLQTGCSGDSESTPENVYVAPAPIPYNPAADPNALPAYAAVGSCCGLYSSSSWISTSVDGNTWIERTNPAAAISRELSKIIYAEDQFLAIGDNGTIVSSDDGITWGVQSLDTLGYLRDIAYGNDKFVVIEGSYIHWSDNGSAWNNVSPTLPSNRYFSM